VFSSSFNIYFRVINFCVAVSITNYSSMQCGFINILFFGEFQVLSEKVIIVAINNIELSHFFLKIDIMLKQIFINPLSFLHRHKRKSKDSLPYKTSSSTGSPMDASIVFNGYENPDAFSLRYKVLERQQNHFDVSCKV
jgi:hypothetical protein